jgi:tetratricopeptide (TPR) repeat protein
MAYLNQTENPYYFGMKVVDNTKFEKSKSVTIYDYTQDNANYFFKRGYVVKAKSAFRNTFVQMFWADLAAKQMGSDIMLCKREYVGTASGASVVPWYVPGETYTLNSRTSGSINATGYGSFTVIGSSGYAIGSSSSSAYGSFNSNTTTTIQGPGRYDYYSVPYSYKYYDQYALFLVKKYYWLNNRSSMYKEANTKSEIIKYVNANEWFEVINKSGKFIKINLNGFEGYIEKASGIDIFSNQSAASIIDIKYKLINSAVSDSKVEKYAVAGKKLYDAYLLDKKDTINLYYAASTYVNAKEYDKALDLYDNLKTLNYSGKGTSYFAVNKLTTQEDFFTSLQERDRMVKLGTHEKPRTEVVPSKIGEIYKNMALILVEKGKTEEAKKAISEARIANPDDASLTLTEANLYLDTRDFVMYKKLIAEVLAKNPNDADLVFNLGVLSANAKDVVNAEKYYARTMEINPKYVNAYINMVALKLEAENAVIAQMNKLGTSDKDMKRYAVLMIERQNIFKSVIPYLEKAMEVAPTNEDVARTLLNVYSALEMTAEKKALEAKMN